MTVIALGHPCPEAGSEMKGCIAMKQVTHVVCPSVCFGLAGYFAWLAVTTTAVGTRAALVARLDTVDVGTIGQGQTATAHYELVNRSEKLLKVQGLISSCGCTQPIINRKEIPRGETAQVDVEYQSKSSRGAVSEWIEVRYCEGESPRIIALNLRLTAAVRPDYDVDPPSLVFRAGEAGVRHVNFTPKRIEHLQLSNVTCDRGWFAVSHAPGPRPGSHVVTVTFDPGKYEETSGEATLVVRTDSPGQPAYHMPLKVVEKGSPRR